MTKFDNTDVIDAFLRMDLRYCDEWMRANPQYRDHIVWQIQHYPAFALPTPQNPVAICGLVSLFGSGTIWMVTGDGFEKQVLQVLPLQRRLCADLYKALGLHRMDMEVLNGRDDAARYAEKLGFEFECVKQRAGANGEHLLIYLWPDERGQ